MSTSTSISRTNAKHDHADLREQVRVLGEDVKELGRMTKDLMASKVENARSAAMDAVEAGRDKVVDYRDRLADATREKPLKSVMIAAGVGAVLGLLLGRR